jgi:hypothetical protein
MKKLLFTFALILCSVVVFSQKFGAKAGVNFATFGADATNQEIRTAFHIGGYAQFPLSDKITLQPELLFNSLGEGSSNWTMNYLSIPVIFAYNFNEKFSVHAGPYLGILMSADVDGTDVKDEMSGTDIGLNLGVGYNLGKINLYGRYSTGFSNILDNDAIFGSAKLNNVAFQFGVGYTFVGGD